MKAVAFESYPEISGFVEKLEFLLDKTLIQHFTKSGEKKKVLI